MSEEMEVAVVDGVKATWAVFPNLCKGCGLCIEKCPVKCITWSEELGVYGTPRVQADGDKCIACGLCQLVCPDCALLVKRK